MNITPAIPAEADALTEIAFAAKRRWGYPAHWMAQWKSILTVTPASIAAHETYAARDGECIIGFCALRRDGEILRLEDLFVLPSEMGRGVGRSLFRHAQRRACEMGFSFFEIESDPNAAGFYERMGAERIGTNVTMLHCKRRELPAFRCNTRIHAETATSPRRATLDDMPSVAKVHRLAFFHAMPEMPVLHTPDEDLAFYSTVVFPSTEVWLTEHSGSTAGFIAFRTGWVDHLYMHPDRQGIGMGSLLLDLAQSSHPSLRLWTFQCNVKAHLFYERRGFKIERETDGANNEERQPDILYCWTRDAPME